MPAALPLSRGPSRDGSAPTLQRQRSTAEASEGSHAAAQPQETEWGVRDDTTVWFRCPHEKSRIGVVERLSLLSDINGFSINKGWCEVKWGIGRGEFELERRSQFANFDWVKLCFEEDDLKIVRPEVDQDLIAVREMVPVPPEQQRYHAHQAGACRGCEKQWKIKIRGPNRVLRPCSPARRFAPVVCLSAPAGGGGVVSRGPKIALQLPSKECAKQLPRFAPLARG